MRSILISLTLCVLFYSAAAQVGDPVTSFGGTGIVKSSVNGSAYNSIAVQADGKIVAGGKTELVRYNTNGTLDASFGAGGRQSTNLYPVKSIALQSDGKIIVGSAYADAANYSAGFILLRYTSAGKLDSTFGINGIRNTDFTDIFNDRISFDGILTFPSVTIKVQTDGKIVAVGLAFIKRGSESDQYYITFARYSADGISDRTFGKEGKGEAVNWAEQFSGDFLTAPALALQPDRKLVVASSKNGDFTVSRYNTNGGIDSSFGTDGMQFTDFGFEDIPNAIALQADGKIILSGASNGDFAMARYLSNGSSDLGFDGDGVRTDDISSFSNDAIYFVAVQTDGKIVVGGTNGSRFALARYNTSGGLDNSFSDDGRKTTDVGSGVDTIYNIAISGNTLFVAGVTSTTKNLTNGVVAAYALGTLPSTADGKTIKVNVYGGANAYNNTEWNNWDVTSSLNSGTLNFTNGTASTISAVLSNTYSIIDNGSGYGGYMAPPAVLRYGSTGTSARMLTFSGLLTTKKYSLELYATRANTGNSTRFTINGNTVTIATDQNKTDKASFINLVPTSGGQIVVSINNVHTYNYVNGFVLTEQNNSCTGAEITPLYPLSGQFCSGNSITLTASGGTSYQWYRANGSVIAGQTGPTYNATEAGIYTVRAFNGACASGLSEGAALEGTLAFPGKAPERIGNQRSGFYCVPANIGIVTAVGQKYTWLQNGKPAKGPVDGSGNPISFSFNGAPQARIVSNARTTDESEYTIQPTYYTVYTTKPGCTDTITSGTVTVYHATPVQGLTITSLNKTSVAFTWKPLYPDLFYHYEVTDVETNAKILTGDMDYETDGLHASTNSLVSGKTYKIVVTASDPNSSDGCTTQPATLQFTAPIPTITTFLPASGAAGVGVMIKGTDFTSVSAVRFNGVAATETYVASPTLLYAKVPSGATTGKIQVAADGLTATTATNFTVAAITSTWVSKTGLTTARLQHGTIATGGKIYVFGGRNGAGLLNSLEIYTPATNTWAAGASMPVAVRGMAFALGADGIIYMFGGANSSNTINSSYKYSPSSNTWTAIANAPDAVFEAAAAATSNGKIYLFGGEPVSAKNTSTNATRIYDIASNTWSAGANMPVGVQQHNAITGSDGKIYVIGGRAFSANEPLGLVQIYNPGTNTWTSGAPMLIPKVQAGAIKAGDGRIFIIGGKANEANNSGPFFHTVEIYSPSTDSWANGPVLPKPFGQQTAAKLNDDLYTVGGSDGTYRNYNYQLVLTPVTPSTLTATAASSSQINLTWKDNSLNETGFVVERATASAGPFSSVASVGSNVKTYSNTGLTSATTYYYRVKALNAAGSSAYSNVASATTLNGGRIAIGSGLNTTEESFAGSDSLSVHPNPARGSARIGFVVPTSQQVQVGIYDARGNLVAQLYNGVAEGNKLHWVEWKAGSATPGMYIGRLITAQTTVTKKIILLPN